MRRRATLAAAIGLVMLAPSALVGDPPDPPGGVEGEAEDDPRDPNVPRDVSHYHLDKKKLAIKGYDPVAYFPPEQGGVEKPTKGKPEIEYVYRGVAYRFASVDNRERFREDPRRYEPAYGGWCATAMAEGDKVEIDPKSFKVTDGRLFLFWTGLVSDARDDWVKREGAMTAQADRQWKSISGEDPRKPEEEGAEDSPPGAAPGSPAEPR